MTRQRKVIYDIIINSLEHLSAEEIFLKAKKVMPTIALGTVYRNLGLMVDDCDIGKVELLGEPAKYDRSSVPHCHMRCLKCGKVDDIILSGVDEMILKNVKNIVNYHLDINYICDDCKSINDVSESLK
ncbi:MAG: transcriptional repressor [Clostridia bacterium]